MTSVAAATSSPYSTATTSSSSTSSTSLGKDDFLTLLVAQFQNQDPLNPQDGSAYVAQLAQFSSLEQAITTNEYLENLTDLTQDMSNSTTLNMLNMLGQTVTIETSTFEFDESSVELGFNLDETATEVSINIFDENDSLVCTLTLDDFSSGENFVTWDGTDNDGNPLGTGEYTFQVVAKNEDDVLDITEMIREKVSGIDLNDGEMLLITSAGNFTTDQVTKINQSDQ